MNINSLLLALISFSFLTFNSIACSPCSPLSNISQNVNGTDLELNFTSNAGWDCCFTVQIEVICENANFSGVPNYFSQEICLNGGNAASTTNTLVTPYPLTVIDMSGYCPGVYKWRAVESGCGIYTPVQTFTIGSPMIIAANAAADTICLSESTQLTSSVSNGCSTGTYTYSWSPAAGLSNANIANPIASPLATTTYTLSVTETGACVPQTVTTSLIVNVNELPVATIAGTASFCQNSPSGDITFTGSGGTPPYTIDYTLNGVPQTPIVTNGSTTIQPPTSTPGTYTYALTSISESSSLQCSQAQSQSIVITIDELPIVNAGTDQTVCEPNGVTTSEVTLSGSGASSYTWDNGVTNGVPFTPTIGTTTYTVTGTDANGCVNTDQVTVTTFELPIALGSANDLFGNAPLAVEFTNLSQDAISYTWDFGNGNTQNTTSLDMIPITYLSAGFYTVLLTASNGLCFDTWTIEIEVVPPMIVTPPNVFTPNGDNINDEYFVDVQFGAEFEALIVNRWGNEITTLTHLNQGWDGKSNGKVVDDGVYFIKYKAKDFNDGIIEGHTYFHILQ